MYGAGQNVIRKLLPDATLLHAEFNPGFNGTPPEPIAKNLLELSGTIERDPKLLCGLATDGDADRIGFFNSSGKFIDSHHLILLLTVYLSQHKGLKGKIVKSFSVSNKVDKLAAHYGIETITTKIGFKYICEIMITDDVLIGAEESGGIAIKGHIPERDGVWMGLVLLEFMAVTGKTIEQLIDDVYALIGSFAFERYDLHISEEVKQRVIEACKAQSYTNFGSYNIVKYEAVDGYKFHFDDDNWVMIRPSGTEPVLRVYAEAPSSEKAFAILDATKEAILA
jgi:phosphomannomutase